MHSTTPHHQSLHSHVKKSKPTTRRTTPKCRQPLMTIDRTYLHTSPWTFPLITLRLTDLPSAQSHPLPPQNGGTPITPSRVNFLFNSFPRLLKRPYSKGIFRPTAHPMWTLQLINHRPPHTHCTGQHPTSLPSIYPTRPSYFQYPSIRQAEPLCLYASSRDRRAIWTFTPGPHCLYWRTSPHLQVHTSGSRSLPSGKSKRDWDTNTSSRAR